jgi:hypothetical protein
LRIVRERALSSSSVESGVERPAIMKSREKGQMDARNRPVIPIIFRVHHLKVLGHKVHGISVFTRAAPTFSSHWA